MNDTNTIVDLTECDREPIHIPGSIQPHGLLLVADLESLAIVGVAGDVEGRLWPEWSDKTLNDLYKDDIGAVLENQSSTNSVVLDYVRGVSETFEAVAHRSDDKLIVELEPAEIGASSTALILADLDSTSSDFERSFSLRELCQTAAMAFRNLTRFDRVMIYQFLDNGTGVVVAEDKAARLGTFLNHHFPATDIPKQARALYIRNRVRVIPDVSYDPAPLRSNKIELAELDLSDVNLRSVSPVHIQYLKNMQVQASASISIVRDGVLWGLIACHHSAPKHLALSKRLACRALAGGLARQIRAKDEAETYRERIRLRTSEDAMLRRMAGAEPLDSVFTEYGSDFGEMLGADGFVASTDGHIYSSGEVPEQADVEALLQWVTTKSAHQPFSTDELSKHYPPASRFSKAAGGMLSVTVTGDSRLVLMWFRMEEIQMLNWAGNPHKETMLLPNQVLTPRASFEKWTEEVKGKSRPWTLNEMESARRLSQAVLEVVQKRHIEALNRQLSQAVAQKDGLLLQKDFLMREIDHRVQNSLQLVSSFLGMQARMIDDQTTVDHFNEARSRLAAVALVHRRLYSDDQTKAVDLSRYLGELCREILSSVDAGWQDQLSIDLAPILMVADRAINVGLVFAELIMNANKYAYGGSPGPLSVVLEQHRGRFRLIVSDQGSGMKGPGSGFGTKMLNSIVTSLGGKIEKSDSSKGLRVIVTAPIVQE